MPIVSAAARRYLLFLPFSLIPGYMLSSCGGSSTSTSIGNLGGAGSGDSSWRLAEYSYTAGGGASNSQTDGETGVIVVGTTGFDYSNGDYSGSVVSIGHTANGPGDYIVMSSTSEYVNAYSENTNANYIHISCVAGTINTNPPAATGFQSTGGIVSAIVDDQGRYHFSTIEPLLFEWNVEVGDGIPNAPEQIKFEMSNIYSASDI